MLNAVCFYRVARWCYLHYIPVIPRLITLLIFLIYNSKIPYTAQIGEGTKFGYGGIGCVLHARTVAGKNCMVGPNVTIGGRSSHYEVPVIGDNVEISTGSKVLGPIRVGDNVVIGANAVVIKDVPENAVVAGVPAKILKITPSKKY